MQLPLHRQAGSIFISCINYKRDPYICLVKTLGPSQPTTKVSYFTNLEIIQHGNIIFTLVDKFNYVGYIAIPKDLFSFPKMLISEFPVLTEAHLLVLLCYRDQKSLSVIIRRQGSGLQ